jgi:3-oxoacyl-[acyl-carrier-protein] synthase II
LPGLPGGRERWGTSIGVGIGGIEEIENATILLKESGPRRISPFFMPYVISNMAAGVVSRLNGLKGPNICTTTACTSGTHGVGEAWLYIRSGMADVMVCGGSESAISRLSVAAFASMKALSTNNDHPEEASRPFDLNRDGFVMGEGSGVLVLEELEHAKKRGARIYAEMVGYGMSADAHHITAPSPEGEGAQRCMRGALDIGKVPLDQVDYINAHGTSTELNDKYESAAIGHVFGDKARGISISSTKGVTGHCLGAAGGIEAVFTALTIHHSLVPPTANLRTPDPSCPLDYTPLKPKERKIRYAMSNSFGFGGTNGTIVLKRLEG